MSTRLTFRLSLLLFVVTLAAYAPVVTHDFLFYDDSKYVYDNPQVRHGLSWPGFAWAWTTFHASNWHPLTWLSHMLDCQLYGPNAGGHHFTSLLFHVANSVGLFLVLGRMTGAV